MILCVLLFFSQHVLTDGILPGVTSALTNLTNIVEREPNFEFKSLELHAVDYLKVFEKNPLQYLFYPFEKHEVLKRKVEAIKDLIQLVSDNRHSPINLFEGISKEIIVLYKDTRVMEPDIPTYLHHCRKLLEKSPDSKDSADMYSYLSKSLTFLEKEKIFFHDDSEWIKLEIRKLLNEFYNRRTTEEKDQMLSLMLTMSKLIWVLESKPWTSPNTFRDFPHSIESSSFTRFHGEYSHQDLLGASASPSSIQLQKRDGSNLPHVLHRCNGKRRLGFREHSPRDRLRASASTSSIKAPREPFIYDGGYKHNQTSECSLHTSALVCQEFPRIDTMPKLTEFDPKKSSQQITHLRENLTQVLQIVSSIAEVKEKIRTQSIEDTEGVSSFFQLFFDFYDIRFSYETNPKAEAWLNYIQSLVDRMLIELNSPSKRERVMLTLLKLKEKCKKSKRRLKSIDMKDEWYLQTREISDMETRMKRIIATEIKLKEIQSQLENETSNLNNNHTLSALGLGLKELYSSMYNSLEDVIDDYKTKRFHAGHKRGSSENWLLLKSQLKNVANRYPNNGTDKNGYANKVMKKFLKFLKSIKKAEEF